MTEKKYFYLFISLIMLMMYSTSSTSMIIPEDIDITVSITDTIPLKERTGNFINDPKINPFDITPSSVEQKVELDPETGNYIVFEKIGDEFYRTPNIMTFQDYLEWKSRQDEKRYFQKLAGININDKSRFGKIDPLSKIDVQKNVIDRLFGGSDISIQPTGNIDLVLGTIYNKNENPFIAKENQVNGPLLDFDMDIRMSVDGQIGDKMKLGFNYDTQATFDFDKKMKLEYDSEQFSEDDIIKKIEAGNVSFPLKSSLIQGVESLFGLKTDLQFGHLKISAIAAEQRSKQKNLRVQNGAVEQEYEIRPDEYDENRHYFISHYHRERYEEALSNLPQIRGLVDIFEIEVWITNTRNDAAVTQQHIVGIADLAEGDMSKYEVGTTVFPPITNPDLDNEGAILPYNEVNDIYKNISTDDVTRGYDKYNRLSTVYGLKDADYEYFVGKKLNSNEFTFHPKLGTISLNQRLRANQTLAVGYSYTYRGEVYHVGDAIQGGIISNITASDSLPAIPEKVRYMKLLKAKNTSVSSPSWDLMMKNVYSIGTANLNQEGFQFDVFYEDNSNGSLVRFLPENGYRNKQLLEIFNLDRLNTRLDPQQDGVFDFVPGITVIPRTGVIIFPKLEPFGSSLEEEFDNDPVLIEKYAFNELYDSTKTSVDKFLHKNRFVMKGEFKSDYSSDISLGAFNVPEGSVRVTAGGVQLVENVDYEINYGLGQVKIINTSYLSSGQPINIQFEDNATFSQQTKNMLGLRAEYDISKNMNVGATYLRLFEKPYTEKVNIGEDPINNRVFGVDFNYGDEAPFVTRMLDKLPFYSTQQPSNINFSTEVAVIKPGHSSAIDLTDEDGGLVSIDDFEGSSSRISLSSYGINSWALASTPRNFGLNEEYKDTTLAYGANRALLNWYSSYNRTGSTGQDNTDSYTRSVSQNDLFQRQFTTASVSNTNLYTLSMSYYPEDRGPYNFDVPDGYAGTTSGIRVENEEIKLNNPRTRWAGIMRSFQNTDFEALNVEYLEFWLLDPYTERLDGHVHNENSSIMDPDSIPRLVINLGSISEDILKDGLAFSENSVNVSGQNTVPTVTTNWGVVPLTTPITTGFDKTNQSAQDLGFDGLADVDEINFFQDYIDEVESFYPGYGTKLSQDPSNDNFVSVEDPLVSNYSTILRKLKKWNGTESNSEYNQNSNTSVPGNPQADTEDINNNKALETTENFWEYNINLNRESDIENRLSIDNKYITEVKEVVVEREGPSVAQGTTERWYRFRIPLSDKLQVGNIESFRSIEFIRMYMTGFTSPKILRFAELELVRNQWRRNDVLCKGGDDPSSQIDFSIDQLSKFDHENKKPFGYVIPKGVKVEKLYSTQGTTNQDEKSLALNFCNLADSCEVSIFKLSQMDLRQFERLQLFVHGEVNQQQIEDGDLSVYMKVGKDFKENYYEYEVPLVLSDVDDMSNTDSDKVWRPENKFDFPLSLFTELKKLRNADGTTSMLDPENAYGAKVSIAGNPSLGYIKGIEIGVRSNKSLETQEFCGEVWVNELRVSGFKEKGGLAATAQLDMQLADLGTLSAIGNYSTVGWGAIDKKLNERQKEEIIDYSIATNLQLGKLLPKKARLSVPFYAQYSQTISKPQYDPYDLDLTVDEKIEAEPERATEIKDRAQDKTTIKAFNFTNVKREASDKGKIPKPWDLSNFSISYAYTKMEHTDPILSLDETLDERAGLDYTYKIKAKYIKPFKFIKSKSFKFISAINFNPIPTSFTFSNKLQRFSSKKEYRLPEDIDFTFDDKRFDWNRRYNLTWNLMKDLKFTFNAENLAVVDELRQTGIKKNAVDRDWVDVRGDTVAINGSRYQADDVDQYWKDNFKDFGRNKSYNHKIKIDYTLPLKNIPFLSFAKVKAGYQSTYNWDASALNIDYLGNVVSNGQSRSLTGDFKFEKLYNKSKYLKKIQKSSNNKSKKASKPTKKGGSVADKDKKDQNPDKKDSKKDSKKDRKKDDGPSLAEKLLIRPFLLLRSIKLTYKENLGTTIPGLSRDLSPELFGLSNQFEAPGWEFVAGLQPELDSYFDVAGREAWISSSNELNQNILQFTRQNYEAKIVLEPINSFKIDLSFKKTYDNNHSRLYSNIADNGEIDFQPNGRINQGSFETTYFSLNTLFGGKEFNIEDNKTRINKVFQEFKDNRVVISNRLPNHVTGGHPDNTTYAYGYGDVSNEVLIPAFLAAYEGKDANNISLNLKEDISKFSYIPAPSWKVKYDGLSKLRWFKDVFKTINLTHGYKSTLKVSSFSSNLDYDSDADVIESNPINNNYYSQYEIPALRIQEAFNPLIGLTIQTQKGMKISFEYNKKRDLLLESATKRLQEGNTSELNFSFGYIVKNVDIPFLTGSNKKKRKTSTKSKSILDKLSGKDKEPEEDPDDKSKKKRRKKVKDSRGNDLTINFDFAIRDDVRYVHDFSLENARADRGSQTITLSPNIEYDIHKNLSLVMYFDYRKTIPYLTSSFNQTNMKGGFKVRFKLN